MTSQIKNLDEGDECPKCGEGTLNYVPHEDCYCHNSPPCHYCTEQPLLCDNCGERHEQD